ncbi:MAG: ABC transporter permease [Chloroflexota bacterium]|nr:ABC transporter permease [Chloroflexota bacterium]
MDRTLDISTPTSDRTRVTVIEATPGWAALRLGDLWRYRELLYLLTWRDVKVRYKQAVLGSGWAIIQPVVTMIVFTLIFGRIAHLPSDGIPYPLFTFAALLPWTYFSYVLAQAGSSLVYNAGMLSKVYFPRLILPVSAALAGLVDLAISFLVLIVMMVYFGVHPHAGLLLLPLFLLFAAAAALSVGIWLAALNVRYRDVKYVIPFLTQIWLYASPVAYSARLVSGKLAFVYSLNPMAGVIEGFRWSLLGVGSVSILALAPSLVVTTVLLVSGLLYFRRSEQTFADVV